MFSQVGRKKTAWHVCLYIVNIVVLALAVQVNSFQEFFFVADLFPFGLSIATLVLLTFLLALDLRFPTSYTGRPQFEIGFFATLTVFWLASNVFSTSRWSQVPMACNTIPAAWPETRVWCKNLQALKAFVWVEWLLVGGITLFTLRYTLAQYLKGHKHIVKMSLSRYSQYSDGSNDYPRNSDFIQWGKSS